MADNQLTTATNTGIQSTTQSPQAVSINDSKTAAASSVQPGTAASALTSDNGVLLKTTPVTTVNLAATTQSVTSSPVQAAHHHVSAGLLGISLVFLVIAVGLFWSTTQAGIVNKNTTN